MSTSPIQIWLFVTLTVWLLLASARQVFDLIGKLWIPVIFNLLQILCCINGIFAVSHQRLSLLTVLTISSLASIGYNVLIMLWYAGMLGDRDSLLLSAGLPYSHSFFLRYTPQCASEYNLTTARWVQSNRCILPYYNVEGIQALIHVVIALITVVLTCLLLFERHHGRHEDCEKLRDCSYSPTSNGSSSDRPMPSLYGDAEHLDTKIMPPPPDSINDVNSGYMNSSYDGVDKSGKLRKSLKACKTASKQALEKAASQQASSRNELQLHENESVYSSVTTQSLSHGSGNSVANSRTSSFHKRSQNVMQQSKKRSLNRSVSPVRRTSDDGYSEEDEIARQYSKMRSKSANCLRAPNQRAKSVAEQRLSQAAFEQMRRESSRTTMRQESPISACNHPDNGDYLQYIKCETKPLRKAVNNQRTRARISFDPKSSNDFLRIYEHVEPQSMTEDCEDCDSVQSESDAYRQVMDCGIKLRQKRTTSQDSVPSIQAPILTMSHQNLDSGHDSSPSTSPDWSQVGISCVTQRPTASPPLSSIIEASLPKPLSSFKHAATVSSTVIGTALPSHIAAFSPASTSTSFSTKPGVPLIDSLPPPPIQLTTRFLTEVLPSASNHVSLMPMQMYDNPRMASGIEMISPGMKLTPLETPKSCLISQPEAFVRSESSSETSSNTTQFDSKPTNHAENTSVVISSTGLLV